MFSFLISLCALVLGYFLYGRLVDRIFGPDPARKTPAVEKADGVDFVVLPNWKVFMIQFLNIAGTGPIFGAIMGAKFGPACYLWIVLGSIFAGGVHDYFSGMLSLHKNGETMPAIVGTYMGERMKRLMLCFSLLLLLLVGTVFVYSPALIFNNLAGNSTSTCMIWVAAILLYYILATLLPVDRIIGKLYPIFGITLMFMALALMVCLLAKWPSIPEVWDGLGNLGAQKGLPGMSSQDIFPCMFITIACGALSGFHSTQSPIMARCLKNEKAGRPIFYGAMITEGIVALIWAAVSSYFFFDGGAEAIGAKLNASAPEIVNSVSRAWLGTIGGILAIIGVAAAPITSGDTAFRSARLIIADFFNIRQDRKVSRLTLSVPIFAVTAVLLYFNISNEDGFNIIWRYFGWANQSLASFTLWLATKYLIFRRKGNKYLIASIPAMFITAVSVVYIFTAKIGFGLPSSWSPIIAAITVLLFHIPLVKWLKRRNTDDK